jgi:hypothetical protein
MDGEVTVTGRGAAFGPERGPRIGQSASRTRLVTARDAELLAELHGDGGALALDAADPPPTTVPAGVAGALLDAVLTRDVPGSPVLRLDLRFPAPVRPGDVITASVEVVSTDEGGALVGLDVRVVRDDGVAAVVGTAVCRTARVDPDPRGETGPPPRRRP